MTDSLRNDGSEEGSKLLIDTGQSAKKPNNKRMTSVLCQPNKVQEKPETHSCHGHEARTCEFVIGCGRHGNTTARNGHASGWGRSTTVKLKTAKKESKSATTNSRDGSVRAG